MPTHSYGGGNSLKSYRLLAHVSLSKEKRKREEAKKIVKTTNPPHMAQYQADRRIEKVVDSKRKGSKHTRDS